MKKLLTFLIILFSITSNVVWSADFNKGWDAYHRGDYATALLEWRPLAEQGDRGAQYNLGQMYRKGEGVPQNYKSAVKWYKLAANQGSNDAQWNLGVMYSDGMGVEKNHILGYMYAVVSGSNADGEWAKSNMTQDELSTAKKLVKDCKSANNRCETVVNNLVKEADAKKEGYESFAAMQADIKKKAAERKRVADAKKAAERKSSFPYKARITCSDDMYTCAPFTDTFIKLKINNRTKIYDFDDLFNKYRLPGCGDPVCVIDLPESFALTVYRHGLGIPGLGKITVRILDNNNNILFEDQTASDYGVISVYNN
jgi:hypothetical protein